METIINATGKGIESAIAIALENRGYIVKVARGHYLTISVGEWTCVFDGGDVVRFDLDDTDSVIRLFSLNN
jgi:hypothetical protein